MASRAVDPRLEAWLRTTIGRDLSPIKRKNYFTRLMAWVTQLESELRASATWPRLPLAWTRYEGWDASLLAGMPRPWWLVTGVAYQAALLDQARVGSLLRGLARFAAPAVENGALGDLWAWVAWDAARAWVFLGSAPPLGGWTDGEEWMESWTGVDDLVWVDWSVVRTASLRCRWDEGGVRRDFVPDASPAPRDFDFAADDVGAMRALLAGGPMKSDPERLPGWLLQRYAGGEVQIRPVPVVFESRMCFPDDTVFR